MRKWMRGLEKERHALTAAVASLTVATAFAIGTASPAIAQQERTTEQAAAALRQTILNAIARLPAGSSAQVYSAQIALVVDSALQNGTAAGNIAGLTRVNADCIVVLRALDGAIGSPVDRNARRAMIDLRANLRSCNVGTGAGPGLSTGFDFALPGVNVGGGSDYQP